MVKHTLKIFYNIMHERLKKIMYTQIKSFMEDKVSKFKSSRPELCFKKGILGNFAKFAGKHLCQSLFFNKVAGLIMQLY